MLGSALFHQLPQVSVNYKVWGTSRGGTQVPLETDASKVLYLGDVFDKAALQDILDRNKIDIVINAIGLIKQISSQLRKGDFVKVNSWLPHYLAQLCEERKIRFIEISTDCVFTGNKGNYLETDPSDATDIYGMSKYLGEVTDYKGALTIRTSIIGHESGRNASLVDWFLSEKNKVEGYEKAIFSGFPTVYLAQIIGYYIIPAPDMSGLYHISADPINKFELLTKIAKTYKNDVEITPNTRIAIDRSLNSNKFRRETGFSPPNWDELVEGMHSNRPAWK